MKIRLCHGYFICFCDPAGYSSLWLPWHSSFCRSIHIPYPFDFFRCNSCNQYLLPFMHAMAMMKTDENIYVPWPYHMLLWPCRIFLLVLPWHSSTCRSIHIPYLFHFFRCNSCNIYLLPFVQAMAVMTEIIYLCTGHGPCPAIYTVDGA